MKRFLPLTVYCLTCAASLLGLFSACGGDDTSTPTPPVGPVSIEITRITLGQGPLVDFSTASVLGCDYQIGVVLQLGTGWRLLPPGFCSTTQCGQVRVSLLGPNGTAISSRVAATAGVELNVEQLKTEASPPGPARSYTIRAELVDDLGVAFAVDGGTVAAEQPFQMTLPSDCAPPSNAGEAGSGG